MWPDALAHFHKHDAVLASFAQAMDPVVLPQEAAVGNYFADLCDSIVGQQLSVKAGATIWARVRALLGNEILPEKVLQVEDIRYREAGMSWAKIRYMKDLADQTQSGRLHLLDLSQQSNEEIIASLTKVKGIGPWTVEMFLMFTLGRPDVFSLGDLGLKRGVQKIYNLPEEPSKQALLELSQKWSPYRTYASRVLWNSLDNEP